MKSIVFAAIIASISAVKLGDIANDGTFSPISKDHYYEAADVAAYQAGVKSLTEGHAGVSVAESAAANEAMEALKVFVTGADTGSQMGDLAALIERGNSVEKDLRVWHGN